MVKDNMYGKIEAQDLPVVREAVGRFEEVGLLPNEVFYGSWAGSDDAYQLSFQRVDVTKPGIAVGSIGKDLVAYREQLFRKALEGFGFTGVSIRRFDNSPEGERRRRAACLEDQGARNLVDVLGGAISATFEFEGKSFRAQVDVS